VSSPQRIDVVVVGAGLAGLYALHRLRELGLSVVVFEAGESVGGTWYFNRYPGARCDFESVDYSFSFSDELQQDWTWSERYATQPEILRYIEHVADRFDLRRDVRLNCEVSAARYDEDAQLWQIHLKGGESLLARYCIMATGALSKPHLPDIAGIRNFCGEILHSSRWLEPLGGFGGRRVGVIGTGSSGVQLIPEIARQADQVYVFQRTANFCMPARNAPLSEAASSDVKANYAQRRAESRASYLGVPMVVPKRSALEVSDEDRRKAFEAGWHEGGANCVIQQFYDIALDERANEYAAEFVHDKIREIVRDPDTAERLLPRGYPFGSKRVCVESGYYDAFNRDNVALVDLRETPIEAITPTGLRTTTAVYEFDVLVLATGFDAMTGSLLAIDIVGREELTLRNTWSGGPRTYLGIGIAGFPNMFCVGGPQSPSVTSNMVHSIEQHIDWITDCIAWLDERDVAAIEPSEAAQNAWVEHVRRVAESRPLRVRGNSWYLGANIPGKPRVFLPYIGGVASYRAKCDEVAVNDYQGFALSTVSLASES